MAKNAGSHSTRSASLPTSTEPTSSSMPCVDGRADRVLRHVAAQAVVVGARPLRRLAPPAHDVRRLPRPDDRLAHAAHRLRVRRDHRDRAEVLQDVLGRDRRRTDPAHREREVLLDRRIEVMADHEHVEVLVDRVDGVRPCRVRRRRQHVLVGGQLDDVGRMAAAGALGVVSVDRAPRDRLDRGLQVTRLVQRVAVQRDLHPGLLGDAQARVDRRRRGAPVLVQLHAAGAGAQLLEHPLVRHRVALAEQQDVDGHRVERDQHLVHRSRARRAGRRAGALRRPLPPPINVVTPAETA